MFIVVAGRCDQILFSVRPVVFTPDWWGILWKEERQLSGCASQLFVSRVSLTTQSTWIVNWCRSFSRRRCCVVKTLHHASKMELFCRIPRGRMFCGRHCVSTLRKLVFWSRGNSITIRVGVYKLLTQEHTRKGNKNYIDETGEWSGVIFVPPTKIRRVSSLRAAKRIVQAPKLWLLQEGHIVSFQQGICFKGLHHWVPFFTQHRSFSSFSLSQVAYCHTMSLPRRIIKVREGFEPKMPIEVSKGSESWSQFLSYFLPCFLWGGVIHHHSYTGLPLILWIHTVAHISVVVIVSYHNGWMIMSIEHTTIIWHAYPRPKTLFFSSSAFTTSGNTTVGRRTGGGDQCNTVSR